MTTASIITLIRIGFIPVYMFFIKDHLGSVRALVSETGTVQQTNDYYPFGSRWDVAAGLKDDTNRIN